MQCVCVCLYMQYLDSFCVRGCVPSVYVCMRLWRERQPTQCDIFNEDSLFVKVGANPNKSPSLPLC